MATISRCGIRMDRFHGGLISRVEGFNSPSRYLGSYSKLTYYEAPDIAFRRFDSYVKRERFPKNCLLWEDSSMDRALRYGRRLCAGSSPVLPVRHIQQHTSYKE